MFENLTDRDITIARTAIGIAIIGGIAVYSFVKGQIDVQSVISLISGLMVSKTLLGEFFKGGS